MLALLGAGCGQVETASTSVGYVESGLPLLPGGTLDVGSTFSDLSIEDEGQYRTLVYTWPDGRLSVASRVNRFDLGDLVVPYMRHMVAAQLFVPEDSRALMIGTGGGAIIHYLQARYPDVAMDSVDIDPVVTDLARTWFGVEESASVRLHTADGFDFIAAAADGSYDLIYMDAFLRPAAATDPSGIPLKLKTLAFYEDLQRILKPQGVVSFNLHRNEVTDQDLKLIEQSFGFFQLLTVEKSRNIVVLASPAEALVPRALKPDAPAWLQAVAEQL